MKCRGAPCSGGRAHGTWPPRSSSILAIGAYKKEQVLYGMVMFTVYIHITDLHICLPGGGMRSQISALGTKEHIVDQECLSKGNTDSGL